MSAIFISDLHLEAQRDDLRAAFLHFLDSKAKGCEQFFILGDLFELWIGDDYRSDFIDEMKTAMKALSDTATQCFFMHGNRDFLIGEGFCRQTGFRLLSDPYLLDYRQHKYLLMHGDLLCTADVEYLKMRQLFRSLGFQQHFLDKSIEERLNIAKQLRDASMEAGSGKSADIMDVTQDEVLKYMQSYGVDTLIHGHTHRPDVHHFTLANGQHGKRIVLSDWDQPLQYLEINGSGCQLKFFNQGIPA